jgi:hypothetical protein
MIELQGILTACTKFRNTSKLVGALDSGHGTWLVTSDEGSLEEGRIGGCSLKSADFYI